MVVDGAFGSSSLSICLALACLVCAPVSHAAGSADLGNFPRFSSLRCVANALGASSSTFGARLIAGKKVVSDGSRLSTKLRDCLNADATVTLSRTKGEELAPVVLLPGAGGNQLEVKLSKDYKAGSFWCQAYKRNDFFRLWLDVISLIPPLTPCFSERIQLLYDASTDTYENNKGVESRVPYFGSTQGMQFLDPNFKSLSLYMSELVAALEKEGYEDGQSLFGAPYDFRYAPGPNAGVVARTYLEDLKKLVEFGYLTNGNRRVVLVAHSLGGLWSLYFLNQQSVAWREKYIKRFVSISTPWGGTVEQMKTYASGNNQGVDILDPLYFRDEQRMSESNLWLLPVRRVFGESPLVVTPRRNYTAYDMEAFLQGIGFAEGVAPYKSRVPSLTDYLEAPKVPVTIIYARGKETIQTIVYNSATFDKDYNVISGDGDGTVNLASLTAVIKDWQETENQVVRVAEISGTSHSGCLSDSLAVQRIVGEILLVEPAISHGSL